MRCEKLFGRDGPLALAVLYLPYLTPFYPGLLSIVNGFLLHRAFRKYLGDEQGEKSETD